MATSPLQQATSQAALERRRLPKPGRYIPGTAAKRQAEEKLAASVRQLVRELWAAVLLIVPEAPARTDASSMADVRKLLRPPTRRYRAGVEEEIDPLLGAAEREQRAAEGRVVSPMGIDVLGGEPWLREVLAERGQGFAALIRDVGVEVETLVARAALEALEKGRPRSWLREQVQKAGGIGERRAKTIARDQVGKLQGALHQARQEDLGIDSYIWRTSRDERTAGNPSGLYPDPKPGSTTHGNHWDREGRRFLWEKRGGKLVEVLDGGKTRVTEYADGHPGEPIQCRCHGEPVIEGLEDLQELDRKAAASSAYKVGPRGATAKGARRRAPTPPRAPDPSPVDASQVYRDRAEMFHERPRNEWRQLSELPEDPDEAWRLLQQDWVQGSKRRAGVALKRAVLQEFPHVEGIPFSNINWKISPQMIERARVAARREYERTQAQLRKQYPQGYVTLWRGVKKRYDVAGAVESWTTDFEVARKFAEEENGEIIGGREGKRVPVEYVLSWHRGESWRDGTFGAQKEVVLMGGWD